MTIIEILYSIIMKPIEYLIELIFSISYQWSENSGWSIILVSFLINIITLPLYKRADAIQEEERSKQAAMSSWVAHIRRNFQKDERYMMLSAYYKECHYHPASALRSSFSLLLQIPFFIAAYHFLSNLTLLQEASFGFIRDLAKPDGLLIIRSHHFNLLPVIMTTVNILSSVIYLKGHPPQGQVSAVWNYYDFFDTFISFTFRSCIVLALQ